MVESSKAKLPEKSKRKSGDSFAAHGAVPLSKTGAPAASPNPSLGGSYSYSPMISVPSALQAKLTPDSPKGAMTEEEVPVQPKAETDDQSAAAEKDVIQEKNVGVPAVQKKCAQCDEEEKSGEKEQGEEDVVQSQQDEGIAELPEEQMEGDDSAAVQMWDCEKEDTKKPTCSIQTKADEREDIVQAKCSACEEEPVQPKARKRSGTGTSNQKTHRIARKGLENASQPLPHRERIQESFGHHDISHVRAEVGGAAGDASKRMGALAYTSGDRIAFRHTPDLHLAAHETAHTVQQRSGLKLPGNVGKAGDRWEKHADRVADRVVAGKPAEDLLDQVAPVSGPVPNTRFSPGMSGSSGSLRTTSTSSNPARGDGIGGAIQHEITSGASRQIEDTEEDIEAVAPLTGEPTGEESAGGAEAPNSERGDVDVGEEEQPTPESACEDAEGNDQEPTPEEPGQAAQEPEEAETGPVEMGTCYTAETPTPPEDAEQPEQDSPANDVEGESATSFPEWEEPNDACECEVGEALQEEAGVTEGESIASQQLPEVSGETEAALSEGGETEESPAAEPASTEEGAGAAAGGSSGESESGSAFASGEAARDQAVAGFHTATAKLADVPTRAYMLSQGLSFAGSKDSGGGAIQRARALMEIRSFLMGAASEVQQAVSFVQLDVPERLGKVAELQKARIDDGIAEQKAAISARIGAARQRAISNAADAHSAISGEYEASVATVNTETDAAIEALSASHIASTENISTQETTALDTVNSRFATARENHVSKGTEYSGKAIGRGQEHVDAFESCKNGYEDDGFWDGCLTVRRARAQQDAACKTASGFAESMQEAAQRKGHNLREQRTQYRCAVISGAGQSLSTLDTTFERLTSGLEAGRTQTLAGLKQTRDMNIAAVDGALQASLQKLTQQEREQRQAVNDSGYIQQVAIEQVAHQVAASLAQGVASAMTTLEETLEQLREQLTSGETPDPATLGEQLASARAGLGGGIGALLSKMQEGADGAEAQLTTAGMNAIFSLRDIAAQSSQKASESEQSFAGQMATLVDTAHAAMAELTGSQVSKAVEASEQGVQSMEQLVTGFADATEQIYTRVDEAIEASMSELETDLQHMEESMDGKIVTEAMKAAAKEQPAWKGVLAIVLIVLVIIASVVVTVLTLGAGAPFLAVVLVGAVVGAITAGLIQVINNWAAGEDLDKGLVQAMVMGAVGGALGGALGAGANGLAQAAVQGAIRAGASTVARAAINVGVNLAGDMIAEAATQTFGYLAFGQQFNWQGFVMAGGMSVASTARGGVAGAPRGPEVSTPVPPRAASSQVRGAMTDLGVGLGLAGGTELLDVAMGGDFDANRFFSSAASGAAGSRAAARGAQGGPTGPRTPPATGLGRTRSRIAGVRDAAFARLELPDTSAASVAHQRGLGAVEEFFAGGAGGMLRADASVDARSPRAPSPGAEAATPPARRAGDSDAEPASRPRDEMETGTRRAGDVESGNQPRRPIAEADASAPVNRMTDAELADMTRSPTRIGDADHNVSVRKRSATDIECDICSRACGAVKQKINDIENELAGTTAPRAQELLDGLQRIKSDISQAEARIEGRLVSGEYQAGHEVINLARAIADSFQSLGARHRTLGDAIDNPRRITDAEAELFPLTGRKGDVQVRSLEGASGKLTDTRVLESNDFTRVLNGDDPLLQHGQECIYVLRTSDGTILKVGKSSHGGADTRFGIYKNAADQIPGGLRLEVTPLKPGLGASDASALEGQLRQTLEAEGHIMPWDSTGRRLSRPGPGVPGERHVGPTIKDEQGNPMLFPDKNDPSKMRTRRGPAEYEWDGMTLRPVDPENVPLPRLPPPEPEMLRQLMTQHHGDVRLVAAELTKMRNYEVPTSTLYSWLAKHDISTYEFKN